MATTEDIFREVTRKPLTTDELVTEARAPTSSVSDLVNEVRTQPSLSVGLLRQAPLAQTDERILDFITEIALDQMDPLNFAALVASFGGWGLAGRAFTGLATAGATRFGSKLFAPSRLARFTRRAAQGLGGAIPFSIAEFIEEPEPDTTRIGNFGRELLFFETFDMALITLGAGGNVLRRTFGRLARDELRAATGASLKAAEESIVARGLASGDDARALAMGAVLEAKVKQAEAELGEGVVAQILEASELVASAPAATYRQLLDDQVNILLTRPGVAEALAAQGLDATALQRTLQLLRDDADDILAQQIMNDATREAGRTGRAAQAADNIAEAEARSSTEGIRARQAGIEQIRQADLATGKLSTLGRMFAQGRRIRMSEDEIIQALGISKPELDALVADGAVVFDEAAQLYSLRAAGIPEPPPVGESEAAKRLGEVMKQGARRLRKGKATARPRKKVSTKPRQPK